MVLAGELDPIITIEDSKDLAAALPADLVRFHAFPGAGHMLALEQPDAVLALIREFVEEEAGT
jgi:proline iminopeptidase